MRVIGSVSAEVTGPDPISNPGAVPTTSIVYVPADQGIMLGVKGGGPITVEVYALQEQGEIVTQSASNVFYQLDDEVSIEDDTLVPISTPTGSVYIRVTGGSGIGRSIQVTALSTPTSTGEVVFPVYEPTNYSVSGLLTLKNHLAGIDSALTGMAGSNFYDGEFSTYAEFTTMPGVSQVGDEWQVTSRLLCNGDVSFPANEYIALNSTGACVHGVDRIYCRIVFNGSEGIVYVSSDCSVRGLQLENQDATGRLVLVSADRSEIRLSTLRSTGSQISIDHSAGAIDTVIEGNQFVGGSTESAIDITNDDIHGTRIADNTFRLDSSNAIVVGGVNSIGTQIVNNRFSLPTFYDITKRCIRIVGRTTGLQIVANLFRADSLLATRYIEAIPDTLTEITSATISDNQFLRVTGFAMRLAGSFESTISGNAADSGPLLISIADWRATTFSDNVADGQVWYVGQHELRGCNVSNNISRNSSCILFQARGFSNDTHERNTFSNNSSDSAQCFRFITTSGSVTRFDSSTWVGNRGTPCFEFDSSGHVQTGLFASNGAYSLALITGKTFDAANFPNSTARGNWDNLAAAPDFG